MIVLTVARGWPIVAFALGGFLLSAAYTAPPLRLKKHGLGEPTVLVVWGPLMVGGTYYAATGSIPGAVILASLPYALLCTTVLMGKHIDKIPWDAPDGTHTLPVILGEARARARDARRCSSAFYVSIVALVIAQVLPVASLLVFGSLPDHGAHVEGVLRAEARGVADAEPGVAVVVRGRVVPRDAARRRPVRARLDRRRDRRLVSSASSEPKATVAADCGRGAQPSGVEAAPAATVVLLRDGDTGLEVLLGAAIVEAHVPRRRVGVPRRPHRSRRLRGDDPTISYAAARARGRARGEGGGRRRRRSRRARPPLELDDARDLAEAVRDVVLRRGRSRAATRSPTAPRPTALQWFGPDEALAARAAGEIELAPPQYVTLLELRDVRDRRRRAGRDRGGRRRSTSRPRFHFVDGGGAVCVYSEDVAYDDLGAARRRRPPPPPLPARRRLGVRPRLTSSAATRRLLVGLGRDAGGTA